MVVSQAGFLSSGVSQALVAGLIGLVAGLASGWQAGSQRARAFAADWARSRQDQAAGSIVALIQEIATKLARAAHAMWWLTWRAAHDCERVTEEALNAYEWELHQLIPEIVGAQAALRAMNAAAAGEVDPAIAHLHRLCASLSEAAVPARAGDRSALGGKLGDALAFKAELDGAMQGAAGRILAGYGRTVSSGAGKERES